MNRRRNEGAASDDGYDKIDMVDVDDYDHVVVDDGADDDVRDLQWLTISFAPTFLSPQSGQK